MERRTFLRGMASILAAGVSPAVLPSGVIMPIKKLITPEWKVINSVFDGKTSYGKTSFSNLIVKEMLVYEAEHDQETREKITEWMANCDGQPPNDPVAWFRYPMVWEKP